VDTRTKIVCIAEARRLAHSGAMLVSGYFDPLIAAHAERLETLKRESTALLVLIGTPQDAILPVRARAELVAALASVNYVAELDDSLTPHVRLELEDEQRLERLIEHVHARQHAAG
jgi:hypothetical protein